MTLTLSPEVEADIREIMRLWGWGKIECDAIVLESLARYFLRNGIASALELARFNAEQMAKMATTVPQSVPDARVFEEPRERFVYTCKGGISEREEDGAK